MDGLGMTRFMFCFSRDPDLDGWITWHDVDRSQDPLWKTVEVTGQQHWALGSQSFKLRKNGWDDVDLGCENGCGVLVDTGSSIITVPGETLHRFKTYIEATGISDCSDLSVFPSLTFRLGDHDIVLPPEAYLADAGQSYAHLLGIKSGKTEFLTLPMTRQDAILAQKAATNATGRNDVMVGTCMLLLHSLPCPQPTQWGPLVIIGMPLFRSYAVQFDLSQEPARYLHLTPSDATCSNQQQPTAFLRHRSALQKMSMDDVAFQPRKIEPVGEDGVLRL